MNRDSSRWVLPTYGFCGTGHNKNADNNVWEKDVLESLSDVLTHALARGLDSCYRLCWEAASQLTQNNIEECRIYLEYAIIPGDSEAKHLIRESLQLIEGINRGAF